MCPKKQAFWGIFSYFCKFYSFYPLFQPIRAFSLKSPLLILAIYPILTHIWCVSIEKSPCKFSISPISTGLKLGISPETHLQIPVLSLIGARNLPPRRPSPISSSYPSKNAYFLLFSPVFGCAIIKSKVDISHTRIAFLYQKN